MREVEVYLTWSEVMLAATVGVRRHIEDVAKKRKDRHGCDPKDGWTQHIQGALGEMVVAKHFDLFWSGNLGDLEAADAGELQVRATPYSTGCLPLHKKEEGHKEDKDEDSFVLVTGIPPRFVIRGWCFGREGKKEEHWKDPTGKKRHAYFVPQSSLRPIDTLQVKRRLVGL